jgi:GTPase SAR1 family protein
MGGLCKKPKPRPNNGPDLIIIDGNGQKKSDAKLDAKIVLIGSSGVGKTSIALRYKEGKFNDNPKATVGASYFQKVVPFKDGSLLRFHIWDTGGQEKF